MNGSWRPSRRRESTGSALSFLTNTGATECRTGAWDALCMLPSRLRDSRHIANASTPPRRRVPGLTGLRFALLIRPQPPSKRPLWFPLQSLWFAEPRSGWERGSSLVEARATFPYQDLPVRHRSGTGSGLPALLMPLPCAHAVIGVGLGYCFGTTEIPCSPGWPTTSRPTIN
jgi:hypothetical protein